MKKSTHHGTTRLVALFPSFLECKKETGNNRKRPICHGLRSTESISFASFAGLDQGATGPHAHACGYNLPPEIAGLGSHSTIDKRLSWKSELELSLSGEAQETYTCRVDTDCKMSKLQATGFSQWLALKHSGL